MKLHRSARPLVALVALAVGTGMMAGCSAAGTSEDEEGSQGGLPFGADKAAYIAAFEDVEPVVLEMQIAAALGHPFNEVYLPYLDRVTEWSGGKITFDIAYASARVPVQTEMDDALADGRLDLSFSVLPSTEPDLYPESDALATGSYLGGGGLVGSLVTNALLVDESVNNDALRSEFEDAGMHLLLPNTPALLTSTVVIACRDAESADLPDEASLLVAVSGRARQSEAEALGMTPVSIPWNEQFEGLQRGVISCAAPSLAGYTAGGLVEVAPHVIIDARAAFAVQPSAFAVSQDTWDALPLVAKQLLFDSMGVYIEAAIDVGLTNSASVITDIEDADGSISELSASKREALADAHERLWSDDATRERLTESAGRWRDLVESSLDEDALELSVGPALRDYTSGSIDFSAYIDLLYQEVLLDSRPDA